MDAVVELMELLGGRINRTSRAAERPPHGPRSHRDRRWLVVVVRRLYHCHFLTLLLLAPSISLSRSTDKRERERAERKLQNWFLGVLSSKIKLMEKVRVKILIRDQIIKRRL